MLSFLCFLQVSDEVLSIMGDLKSVDVLALDPEELLDAEIDGPEGADGSGVAVLSDALSEFKVNGRGPLSGALFTRGGELAVPAVNFPDRPLVRGRARFP